MNPNSAQLRQLKRDNLQFPEHLVEIPPSDWPELPLMTDSIRVKVWRSRRFVVQEIHQGATVRLSVNRTDWDERAKRFRADISWDDLQQLKAECGFADRCAVELFPPAEHVVNVANMRHLFIVHEPPFMWRNDETHTPQS